MKPVLPFLFFIYIFLVSSLYATDRDQLGFLEGTVIDRQTGQPLMGVNVYIEEKRLGAASNSEGKFIIENIPVGIYSVTAAMMGYNSEIKTEIAINVNRSTTLRFFLQSTVLNLEDQIEVTAGFFEKDIDKPVSTKRLTPQEIRSSAGSAEDIFRILQAMPGVSKTGSMSANLIVRGGSPDENRTLLDNVEVYSPLHFARAGTSMGVISIINPALLENVEFLTGGFPARYGDKLSSVFKMKLKEGNQTRFNTDVNINVSGFGLTLDGPLTSNSNIIFSARRGFFDYITEMMGRPVNPRFWDLVGKVTFNPGTDHKLSVVGFYYMDEFEKTDVIKSAPYKIAREYSNIMRDVQGSAIGINWRYLISNTGYVMTTASLINNNWKSRLGNQIQSDLKGDEVSEDEIHIRSEITFQLSNYIELKGGGLFKGIESSYYQWTESDTTDTGHILPADTTIYEPGPGMKSALFAQTSWKPVPWFNVTAGLRMDHYDLTDEVNLSPRLSASFILDKKVSLNFAYGEYFQTPAGYQFAQHEENEALMSSQASHYIAGIEYLLAEDTKLSLEIYHKNLTSLFVQSDTTLKINNQGSGFAEGVELYVQKKMSKNFVGSLAYTYSISKRKEGASLPEYYFDYDQRHNVTLIAGYKLFNDWRIGIKFQYTSGMPYTPVIGTEEIGDNWYLVEGPKNSARLPDFHQLDLRLDKYFRFEKWTLSAYLDLWNVYNRDNVIYYSFEVDENGEATRTENYDFSILPIVGISAQF